MSNRYKFITEKDGKEVHIHTLDGKPLIGTSSVSNVVAKPLHWWALGVGLAKLGWTKIKEKIGGKYVFNKKENRLKAVDDFWNANPDFTSEEWLKLLDECYYAHDKSKKDSAVTGTDLHAELERYVKSVMAGEEIENYDPKIQPFVDWCRKEVKRFIWSEAYCYSEEFWVGGISDLGYERNDGRYGIMDFKSSKEAYETQFWQIAGYDIQFQENGILDRDGNLIMKLDKPIEEYAILPFGAEEVKPEFRYNTEECKRHFQSELDIYKALNK